MNIKKDYKYISSISSIVFVVLLVLFFVWFNSYSKKREGFTNENNSGWSPDLIKRFNIFQTTVNYQSRVNVDGSQLDLAVLQKQASPSEVEHLLETGYWPWPDELKYMYMDKVWMNHIIKQQPQSALDFAMKIYNQTAAKQLLGWNAKEGEFLLYGANIGHTKGKGLPKNLQNTLKCVNNENGESKIEKTVYTGVNLWNGYTNTEKTWVKNEDIPKEMPGFEFVNGPCNPCSALDNDYSCAFRLNVKGDDGSDISPIWKMLWGL
jgi:hypothetical protein